MKVRRVEMRPRPRLRLNGWELGSAYDCAVWPESHLTHMARGVSAILRCELVATLVRAEGRGSRVRGQGQG